MSYSQEIYDAVRSKIHGGDVGSVFAQVAREALDVSFHVEIIKQEFLAAAHEMARPCVVFKPKLSRDGDMYCVLLGEDLVVGVAGFGRTVAEAMLEFDREFYGLQSKETPYDQ